MIKMESLKDKDLRAIYCRQVDRIFKVVLNRPEVHNAFNEVMIAELLEVFLKIAKSDEVRVVVLTGEGKSFCAGGDLNWMKRMKDTSYEENYADALKLSELMHTMYTLPQPTIARVNGAAIGGGAGLVAVCDLAIASQDARFGLSEVKLGLVPACISPYVIRKIGETAAREYFLTGERISAERAAEIGLVNEVVHPEVLDEAVQRKAELLVSSGPRALTMCKELIEKVPLMDFDSVKSYTARMIAQLRVSEEGQEGVKAFLGKRKPNWNPNSSPRS